MIVHDFKRIFVVGAVVLATLSLFAEKSCPRFALIIGNANYDDVGKLRNSVNDATDIAETLKSLDFMVDLITDADLPTMEASVDRFGSRLSADKQSIGFFFYAGHGVQSAGANFLIPVDTRITSEPYLKTKALALQTVLDVLQDSQNMVNIIVLDACRDNPFSWSRSSSRGLTVVGSQPTGSIVTYATGVGKVARDGEGRNGVFTAELLKNLKTRGIDIMEVFQKTGAGVQAATGGVQIPAIYSQFFGKMFLAGGSRDDAVTAKVQPDSGARAVSLKQNEAIGKISFAWLPQGTSVALDGKELARIGNNSMFSSPVLPKQYQLAVTIPDAGVYTSDITVRADQTLKIPRPTSFLIDGYTKTKNTAEKSYQKARWLRIGGAVTIGAGALLAVGGGVAYLVGKGAYSSYTSATTQADADSYRATAETWQNVFWGGLIGAGVCVSVGTVMELSAQKTQPLSEMIKKLDKEISDLASTGAN